MSDSLSDWLGTDADPQPGWRGPDADRMADLSETLRSGATHTCADCQTEIHVTQAGPGRMNIAGLICPHLAHKIAPEKTCGAQGTDRDGLLRSCKIPSWVPHHYHFDPAPTAEGLSWYWETEKRIVPVCSGCGSEWHEGHDCRVATQTIERTQ